MPIDYDKLAKQHGGQVLEPAAVDFDALAAEAAAPQGYQAAAAGAETIGETPWYSKHYLGLPSVTEAARALPAIGGFVGGALASPGLATTVGGAALGGAAGEAARQHTFRALGGAAPATPGEAALGIGKEAVIQGGAQLVGAGIGKGLKAGGERFMQSAVKPTVAVTKEYRTTPLKIVETLLNEGVSVTPKGLQKLQMLIKSTNQEIAEAIASAPGTIPKERVAARALPMAQRLAHQVNPKAALEDVGGSVEEFLKHPTITGALTVPEAQAMKVGTYKQIGKSYGKLSSAAVETQKALARGLKEEIAAEVPKISGLNARESALLAAQDAVGRRVALSGNRDPVGFAWVTNHPATFLAALIDRSTAIKSMLARGMYSSAGKAAKVSPQLIRAAVVALTTEDPNAVQPLSEE